MRISDWSADVCSSDLLNKYDQSLRIIWVPGMPEQTETPLCSCLPYAPDPPKRIYFPASACASSLNDECEYGFAVDDLAVLIRTAFAEAPARPRRYRRSEEHTSELQSLMRISYAVFCLKKKTNTK